MRKIESEMKRVKECNTAPGLLNILMGTSLCTVIGQRGENDDKSFEFDILYQGQVLVTVVNKVWNEICSDSTKSWGWCTVHFIVKCGYISGCKSNLGLKIFCWYIIESLSCLWSHFPNNAGKLLQKIFWSPFPLENLYFAHFTDHRLTVSRGNCKFYNQGLIFNVKNGKMKLVDGLRIKTNKKEKLTVS